MRSASAAIARSASPSLSSRSVDVARTIAIRSASLAVLINGNFNALKLLSTSRECAAMADGYTSTGKITPEWWINAIARGKAFRREYAHEDEWATWQRWYRGVWDKRILPSNVYFKLMRTLIPRIYYRNPSVSLTPSKPGIENMLLAKLLERADNKLIDVLGVKGQMKKAVQHGIMFGTGGLRLGYGAEFTPT